MALDQDNFDTFGNDMIQVEPPSLRPSSLFSPLQCFYDVATVTGEPIRSKTLKYVEHLANRSVRHPLPSHLQQLEVHDHAGRLEREEAAHTL
jgi:hypothetical protein